MTSIIDVETRKDIGKILTDHKQRAIDTDKALQQIVDIFESILDELEYKADMENERDIENADIELSRD